MQAYQHHRIGLIVYQLSPNSKKQIRTCQESYNACQGHWEFVGFLHGVSNGNDLDRIGRIISARIPWNRIIPYQADTFKRKYGSPKKRSYQ